MNYFILILLSVVAALSNAASIANIAQNVHSDVISLNANLASALPDAPKQDFDLQRSGIPIGGAVDLYYRYGFFSLSLRVVPRDDPGTWLVREPTSNIFEDAPVRITRGPNSFAQQPFEISLCDDTEELKEAFFRRFGAEGIAQPHKLYTGSWRTPTTAKYLGLSVDVIDSSSFVLIKLAKTSGSMDIDPRNLRLSQVPKQTANSIRAGDPDSVLNFVQNHGSHFLQSVTIGDAIYQVLALTPEQMNDLKAATRGAKTLTTNDWNRLYDDHLAPWKVRETGTIMVASGDVQLSRFADQQLRLNAQFGSYPNLVGGLVGNPDNVRMLEQLGANTHAVIGANFASLKTFVGNADIQVRQFYDEIVDTTSALWEANLK